MAKEAAPGTLACQRSAINQSRQIICWRTQLTYGKRHQKQKQ
jgi:hypothetical protein